MPFPTFRFEPPKFVDAVQHLLVRVGPSTRMKIVKLLYLADRAHLVRHGTPVLGDRYYRIPFGPVPSRALDLLEAFAAVAAKDAEAEPDRVTREFLSRISITSPETKYATYEVVDAQPERALSRSEVGVLDMVAKQFGSMTALELSRLSHRHRSYLETGESQEIDYRLFFKDEEGVNPDALRYLELTQEDRDFVQRF